MNGIVTSTLIDKDKLPEVAPEYDLRDLLEAGMHFGHQKAKWNPKMDEWIYMEKDGVHIFDLEKTAAQLELAYNFVYDLSKKGKTIVMVGTKRQASKLIEEAAEENSMMYITSRWLGGFLTNWEQVSKSLKRMIDLEKGLKEGKYDKYTKYEQVQLEKELNRKKRFFAGVSELKGRPDAIFVVDPKRESITIAEAQVMGVPVIAVTDSNTDPAGIDIVIPANDDALKSIKFVVDQIAEAYLAGKSSKSKAAAAAKKAAEKEETAKEKASSEEKTTKKSKK